MLEEPLWSLEADAKTTGSYFLGPTIIILEDLRLGCFSIHLLGNH